MLIFQHQVQQPIIILQVQEILLQTQAIIQVLTIQLLQEQQIHQVQQQIQYQIQESGNRIQQENGTMLIQMEMQLKINGSLFKAMEQWQQDGLALVETGIT